MSCTKITGADVYGVRNGPGWSGHDDVETRTGIFQNGNSQPKTASEWALLDALPPGWRYDKTVGSPVAGYVFVTNGESVISGRQQRALLAVRERQPHARVSVAQPQMSAPQMAPQAKPGQPTDSETARTVNDLARALLKRKLLSDILVDLTICEIEGWCKREYVRELCDLLNGIALPSPNQVAVSKMENTN